MNDKIKQLAEQAGFILWQDEAHNPGDVIDWASRYDDELVKYTELVVQECLECSENLSRHYMENFSEQEQVLLLAAIADYSSAIKRQFTEFTLRYDETTPVVTQNNETPVKYETIDLEFSDEELLKYMKMAHELDITFNQLVERALKEAILNAPIDLDKELNDE